MGNNVHSWTVAVYASLPATCPTSLILCLLFVMNVRCTFAP